MKILQLGKFYPIRGGVEKVMWDLTVGLAERGITCDMLCGILPDDSIEPEYAEVSRQTPDGYEISLGPYGRVICVRAITKKAATVISPVMVRWMRKHAAEYDVIHVHHPDPMAALALRLSGYKGRVILHWHSDILSQKLLLFFYKPLQSWLIHRAERIIGTTPVYVRESPYLTRAQYKVTCVPIGIAPVVYDSREVAAFREKYPGKHIVFALGRLVPYKGFRTLVKAASYLGPDYQILIGGTGPLYNTLKSEIEVLNLQERVELLGFVDGNKLPVLFGACDVFVLSSDRKTEAFGIVQIEAMSCGKPVVATQIPQSGVSWVNREGVSGLNVPPGNSLAMSEAIRRICRDPDDYLQFAAGAMERYEELFTSRRMIDKVIKVYENHN